MLVVETIGQIRREHFVQGESIKEIARDLRAVAQHGAESPSVRGDVVFLRAPDATVPKAGKMERGTRWAAWRRTPKRRRAKRLTLIRLFEELRALGYEGGYDAVRRYAGAWAKTNASATANAVVTLGEAYQFDWSHAIVVLDGMTTTVKVAHVRLCRMMSVRGYPREAQEIVFDAHERAFAFFGGATPEAVTPLEPFPTP
jgi:transposase